MAGGGTIWVIAELNADGSLAKSSAEAATLARNLAEEAGASAAGIVVAADPAVAANELAGYVGRVVAVTDPAASDHAWASIAAQRAAAVLTASAEAPVAVLTSAGTDGRDVAGTLAALLERPTLVNATAVDWEHGPSVAMSVFGGKLNTMSSFTDGEWGIVTVRPNVATAEPAGAAGTVEQVAPSRDLSLPTVTVVDRIQEAAAALPIEEARIIVAGGRGVGGEEGFALVREIAAALGGAVGATRAAVDSGWIPYAQQIGQTGKIVKPQLYLALGISGAIQHKVGMQTAGTIVGVNRDPDAPIAEFADLVVVGDLFEVGKALLGELKAR
ncbi:MAG TPA: electron transfer flavoprotein subunit alpha/FixB family protein [Candidatus Limnocylindrales bacterium]|nr:electron transfer flavoprotein subunit alpha/FixB family protein [Candidatus Limnocylindrales bacterium]